MPSHSRSSRRPEASDAAGSGAVPRQPKFLTALPVFNEVRQVEEVLDEVLRFTPHVLVVDDGSTDGTSRLLADRLERQGDIRVVRHPHNRGYGAALATAFRETLSGDFDGLVTIDCDGQHQPRLIPAFIDAATTGGAAGPPGAPLPDIVSGSRYLKVFDGDSRPPESRRRINETITAEINARLGLSLTDAFCGFKAYRVGATRNLTLSVDGYDFPLQFWVQAAANGLRVREIPVRRIYKDLNRTFGGDLDDPERRLRVYRETMHRELQRCRRRLSSAATRGLLAAISKQDAQDG